MEVALYQLLLILLLKIMRYKHSSLSTQQSKTSCCRVSSKKKGLKKSDQTNNPTKSTQPKQLGDCRVEQSQNKSEQNSHNPTKTTPHLRTLQDYVADPHLAFYLKQCDRLITEEQLKLK